MVCVIMYSTKMQVVCAKNIMLHAPKRATWCQNSDNGDQIDDILPVRPSRKTPRAAEGVPWSVSGCAVLKCRCCLSSFGDAHRFLCLHRVRDLARLGSASSVHARARMHGVTRAVLRRMPRTIFRAPDRRRSACLGAAAAPDVPEMAMARRGSHLAPVTAADGTPQRLAAGPNARAGS